MWWKNSFPHPWRDLTSCLMGLALLALAVPEGSSGSGQHSDGPSAGNTATHFTLTVWGFCMYICVSYVYNARGSQKRTSDSPETGV